ncbi:hypothetical protein, partial [Klebsiella aerogenes]|uniref:hypothetical protein n=1 Tax=Klebsiella aerogenes TaxID=548 RepID=UPI00195443D4
MAIWDDLSAAGMSFASRIRAQLPDEPILTFHKLSDTELTAGGADISRCSIDPAERRFRSIG